jgi:hypothetical protein
MHNLGTGMAGAGSKNLGGQVVMRRATATQRLDAPPRFRHSWGMYLVVYNVLKLVFLLYQKIRLFQQNLPS